MKKIILLLALCSPLLSGCQVGYIYQSTKGQLQILNARKPITESENDPDLSADEKRKLKLAADAKQFAVEHLGLTNSKNYSRYANLKRPYVSWVVSASPKNEIKSYTWWFPIVGSFPYKGFFTEEQAKREEEDLKKNNFDTHLRGVSAFSTLGWFEDPIVSPMLRYDDEQLVDTIIHETTHATLFIKNSSEFNEQLATFVGGKGAEMFFQSREGAQSPTVARLHAEQEDDRLFSKFITAEITEMEAWYKEHPQFTEEERRERLSVISARFRSRIEPQLKMESWKRFSKMELNNAKLLVYKTYLQDLSVFDQLYEKVGRDMKKFIETCKTLEKSKQPDKDLRQIIAP